MKKILFTSGIALLALATIVSAQGYSFDTNLTVGSTGADVVALQTWLISQAYEIPAITSGVAAKGYFGSQTLAAVKAYQAANGIPNTGFVGPLTRAAINARGGAVATANCPVGYTCTANNVPVAPVCPLGYTCTANVGTVVTNPGTPIVMDGTDGSALASYSSYVTSGQSIKKGETKNVIAVKLQATGGKVSVNRFDVHFTERPWLIFSQVVLKDSSGAVIATKALASASDVTEVAVGSNYVVRFDNINYVVTPGTDSVLAVSVTVQSSSDKVTGQVVGVSVPDTSIRTINGKGYTDSLGLGSATAVGGTNVNSITLQATAASSGDIYTSISSTAPNTRTVTISTTQTTPDVILGVFSMKSQNADSVVSNLSFNIKNSTGAATTTVFSNVRLVVGSNTYGANSLVAGASTFTNMNFNLPKDIWTDVKLIADVNANQTGISASSTLVATSIGAIDVNYNSPTITNASNVTSNDTTFSTSAIEISGITSSKGSVLTAANSNIWGVAYPTLTFTVKNNSNGPIYISKISNSALATTTSLAPNASSTVTSVVVSGGTTGDDANAYSIGVGSSKTFTYSYTIDNTNGTTAAKKLSITQINYGTGSAAGTGASQNAQYNVNYGLESAYVQVP